MMDNSQQYSYTNLPPPPFNNPAGLESGVYTGPPPIPQPPGPGNSWSMYQHPPPTTAQHQWPPFPPKNPGGPYPAFDPSRPPPTLEPPKQPWTQNQWTYPNSHFRGHFPPNQHSAPPSYQSNNSSSQNYPISNRPWPDNYQDQAKSISASDEESRQRLRDEQWLQSFLPQRGKHQPVEPPKAKLSICQLKEKLYGTIHMVSELDAVCQMLKENFENESVWTEMLSRATELKNIIQESMADLKDPDRIGSIQRKLLLISKKRARIRRRKMEEREEKQEQEARRAERKAEVDKWQIKRIQEVEEKNREKELKLAADAVLSEVRKKQADSKRMQDILKSLEKLRKLRKEAAARRGLFPEKESDVTFEGHLERLRSLIQKRTAVYAVEEKALRVMLEGEQEEERKRDREKRQKKEKEKLLQKKREVESMLFGAELPPDHPLQPFHDYYTQAERSLPALIQIRREWDQFLVPAEHPDGSAVPQGWVLPDQPADDIWATALDSALTK